MDEGSTGRTGKRCSIFSRHVSDSESLASKLEVPELPLSSKYSPTWVLENLMGPNVLWLAESALQVLSLQAGERVLDLGCGRALSSIFLAKEMGVRVWATDLWIDAGENWERIVEAHASELVTPIHAEAHALPFAANFFDTIVSFDAYHYFGTDDLYLGYLKQFLRPGGTLCIVVPGIRQEFVNGVPPHLAALWEWDFCSFHSPQWWRNHWEKTGFFKVDRADMVEGGWQLWLRWLRVAAESGYRSSEREVELLERDAGATLGFTRVVAKKL